MSNQQINAINYRTSYFEYPDLTRISGEPTYETIHTLINQIKANSMSVHSNLGGGAHGHLGLVLQDQAYAMVSNTPYERPDHPGVLNIPMNATRHAMDNLARTHEEALRVFHEVRGIERALIQQIIAAVEPQYVAALRDRTTNQFTGTVLQILTYLKTTYGKITPAALQKLETETKAIDFNVVQPIDTIYHKVEDLVEYADLANAPMTQVQTINIAYNIINKTGRFKSAIRDWNRRPANEKNWINFKDSFRTAQLELRESNALTMQEAGLHNANLVDEIVDRMQDIQQGDPALQEQVHELVEVQHVANAAISDLLPSLIQQMQEMQNVITALQAKEGEAPAPKPRKVIRTKKTGQPVRPLPASHTHYCWTHGRCNHKSADCNYRAEGHKATATMNSKMGGSTFGCPE
jgi:hypothetical protein